MFQVLDDQNSDH